LLPAIPFKFAFFQGSSRHLFQLLAAILTS